MKDFARFFSLVCFSLACCLLLCTCDILFKETEGEVYASVLLPSSESAWCDYTLSDGTETQLWRTVEDIGKIWLELVRSDGGIRTFSVKSGESVSTGKIAEGTYSLRVYAYDKAGTLIAKNADLLSFSLAGGDEKRFEIQLVWAAYSALSSQNTHTVRFFDTKSATVIKELKVSDGATLTRSDFLQKAGLSFITWYKDSSLTKLFFGEGEDESIEQIRYAITLWGRVENADSSGKVATGATVTVDSKEYQKIEISSADELIEAMSMLTDENIDTSDIYIMLNSDVSLDSNYIPYGYDTSTGTANSDKFEGIFDGGGKTITLSALGAASFTPICKVNSGIIQNVKITLAQGASISTNNRVGLGDYNDFGGICEENEGIIRNCWVDLGTVDVHLFLKAGGICCGNKGVVENCLNTTGLVCTFDNGTGGWAGLYGGVGGIVGMNEGGTIKNCVNYGQITLKTTYARGNDINGFSGSITSRQSAGESKNCYWRKECLYTNTEQTETANYQVYKSSISSIREGTFTGNGWFESNTDGTLTAGTADTSKTAQTLEYGNDLLGALNACASADANLKRWGSSTLYAAVLDF